MAEKMSVLDAAEKVLLERGAPVHYKEIMGEAKKRGFIETRGRTPGATLIASIGQENARREKRGELPRFVRRGRGVYGLTRWEPVGIRQEIAAANEQVQTQLLEQLKAMAWERFEDLVAHLLTEMGFEVEQTSRSSDGGVDVRAVLTVGGITNTETAVQVKRRRGNLGASAVRELRGTLDTHQQGLVITTGGFTKTAREEAQSPLKKPISLVDGATFVDLLVERELGVIAHEEKVLELAPLPTEQEEAESEDAVPASNDLEQTERLRLRASHKGKEHSAVRLESGEIEYNGQVYRSPSGACRAATGWKSCDGWRFWEYLDEQSDRWGSLQELRETSAPGTQEEAEAQYGVSYHLEKGRPEVKQVLRNLRAALLDSDLGVEEAVSKTYLAYKLGGRNLVELVVWKSRVDAFIDVPFSSLHDPRALAEDVSSMGHWGTGDTRVRVTDEELVSYVVELVQQAAALRESPE